MCLAPGFNRAKRAGKKGVEENRKVHIATERGEICARLPDGVLCNSHRVFFASALTEIASRAPRETSPPCRRLFVSPSLRIYCHAFAKPLYFPPSISRCTIPLLWAPIRSNWEAPRNSEFRTLITAVFQNWLPVLGSFVNTVSQFICSSATRE